jgi:hypothetical protein
MSKTLKHYKRQHNRTRRLRKKGGNKRRKQKGGITLSELKEVMNQDNHHVVALHSSPTCGHCKDFEPEWTKVLASLPQHPNLTVAKLGQHETDYMNNNHYSKHNYAVNGVPTIVYYVVNQPPREYNEKRIAKNIIKWLMKLMNENGLEITPKQDQDQEQVSYEEPEEGSESFDQQLPSSMDADATAPESDSTTEAPESESALATAPETESATATATAAPDTMADAFPPAPLSPASIADTISTKANDLNDTLKSATESATTAVSSTVSEIGNKLTNLFTPAASATVPAAPTQAPAAAPTQAPTPTQAQTEATVPLNIPPVPSLVGGRRRTRRKHRRSKNKISKKSKKSKK